MPKKVINNRCATPSGKKAEIPDGGGKKEFRPGKRGVFPDGTFRDEDADYFASACWKRYNYLFSFLRAAAAVASNMTGVPIMIEA